MASFDKILPVTEVKRELMRLLKRMQARGGIVAITKDGRAAGILMSPEDYEGLLESLEILEDTSLIRSLNKALKQSQQGRKHSHKDVFKD